MTLTKYGKYILTEPLGIPRHPEIEVPVIRIGQDIIPETWNKVPFSITMEAIHQPFLMADKGHTHDQDENDSDNDGCGCRRTLHDAGRQYPDEQPEEGEKHIITKTTFVYVPKGLIHCPLNFKRVDKPIVFSDILLAPLYYNNPI